MTDWDEMVGYIRSAIEALDQAHGAAQHLRQGANHATFDEFRRKMAQLETHLGALKMVLDNEEAFAIDELMDALSRVYSGHSADYRRTPRMKS